ncbi:hypothetical protein NXY07_20775 [Phocaeicola dorei]|nr:hypothetical protein [Phocaeicola dorei]
MSTEFHMGGTVIPPMWNSRFIYVDHHPTWVEHQMHPFEKTFSIGEKTETDAPDK